MRVPAQTEPFRRVASQFSLRVDGAARQAAMLGPVEHQHLPVNAHRGDYIGVLRLVSRLVDFAGVVNLLLDGHLDRRRLAGSRAPMASNLALFFVIVALVGCNVLGQLDICDLEVIRCVVRRMRADEEAVDGMVRVGEPAMLESEWTLDFIDLRLDVRKPLSCQGRPFQSSAVKS